jgi:Fic family protein
MNVALAIIGFGRKLRFHRWDSYKEDRMDRAAFVRSPVGRLVPIRGYDLYLKREYEHFAFVPNPLPSAFQLEQRTYKLVAEAERAVGRLDAATTRLPNPSLLVRPALYREAISTSAMEGTYAPLAEVFEADYVEEHERRQEVREILNWIAAAERALDLIKVKPICTTVLNELQHILVRGTRGGGADAGRLRHRQVYIGERHRGIEASRFVPPPEGEELERGVDEWEKWINADDDIPLIVKIALGHYQFETLHPYHDGNGRLGRLVMTLQLITAGALSYPLLDLSTWMEPRKEHYKNLMLDVSRTGDFDPWIQFVAESFVGAADESIRRIDLLMSIRQDIVDQLRADGARGVALEIADDLIKWPVITTMQAAKNHGVTWPPANNAIQRMVRLGILEEVTGRTYGRVYYCTRVMRAVEEPVI